MSVRTERSGPVTTVILARPEVRNADALRTELECARPAMATVQAGGSGFVARRG